MTFEVVRLVDLPDDGPWEFAEASATVPKESDNLHVDGRRYKWDGQSRAGFGGPTDARIFWRVS